MAIAPVLKTGARKGLGVRVPHPPSAMLSTDRFSPKSGNEKRHPISGDRVALVLREELLPLDFRGWSELVQPRLHRAEARVIHLQAIQLRRGHLIQHPLDIRDTIGRTRVIREPRCGVSATRLLLFSQ